MYIKSLLLVIVITSLGFFGLLGISTSLITQYNTSTTDSAKTILTHHSVNTSTKFEKISTKIKYSVIDDIAVEKEISSVDDETERSYLLALLKFRQKKYDAAYDLLLNNLRSVPGFVDYYDLLIKSSNILGKLDEVEKQVDDKLKKDPVFFNYSKGIINFYIKDINAAIGYFEKSSELNPPLKENSYWLANSFRLVGNYNKAIEILHKSKSSLKDDDKFLSSVEISMGTNYYLSGNYDEAEEHYKNALQISEKTGNTIDQIKANGNIAIINDLYGETDTARNLLNVSIQKAAKIENQELLAFLHSELGVSFTYTGELIEARKNYFESYKIFTELKDEERLAYLSGNIAAIYLQQSNYSEALKYYNEGIRFSGDNIYGKIINLTGIADVYANLSNYAKALEYYKTAGELADSINSTPAKFKVKEGIGALFFNVNKPAKAIEFFREADELVEPEEYPFETAGLYYKMGVSFIEIKNYEEAKNFILKGIDISGNSGDVYSNLILKTELANLYAQTNEIKNAQKILNDLLPGSSENSLIQLEAVQCLYLAKIKNQSGDEKEALRLFEKSFKLAESVLDFNTQIEAGPLMADHYSDHKNFDKAEYWFQKITSIIDKVSPALVSNNQIQISHFSGVDNVFKKMIRFYLSLEKNEEAFDLLERYRSRNTMQNVVNLKLLSAIKDEQLLNEFLDIKWQLNSGLFHEEEKNFISGKYNSLSNKIAGNDFELFKLLTSPPWMDYKTIKLKLDDKENLVSIFSADDMTEIFLVTNKELKSFRLEISGDSLVTLMKQISPIYQTRSVNKEVFVNQDLFSFDAQSAYYFYKILLSDVINEIPEGSTLIFSLPQELLALPLDFLVTDWREGESPYYYKDKKFLIKRNPVSYTPSVSVYLNQKEKKETKGLSNLLVGDPSISNEEFRMSYRGGMLEDENFALRNVDLFPLEFSRDEIENIDDLVSDNVVLLGADATETNLKNEAPNSNIIHISSHSFLHNSQPLILLSRVSDEKNDGFLELGEIVQMNLNSNLVVLSSCRSGLGEVEEAEGTLGMQKAFFDAGASSVIVSLWDVNDKYTSYFMKNFYENLSNGMNKTKSLQKAKIDFINKYSANPYYWSAFILSGNISNIYLEKPGKFPFIYLISFLILFGILASGFFVFLKIRATR